jgi:arginyl-tRNA synthetase
MSGPASIRETIAEALGQAARQLGAPDPLPDLELARSRNQAHGDFASSAGLKLARVLGRSPDQIAAELAAAVAVPDGIASA